MMKKIFGLVLALVMMLGIVHIPANAAQETIYDANFNAEGNNHGIQFSNSSYRTGSVYSFRSASRFLPADPFCLLNSVVFRPPIRCKCAGNLPPP